MDPQVVTGFSEKTVQGLIIQGRFAVKEAEAFYPCTDGKFNPEAVAGVAPGLLGTIRIRQGVLGIEDQKIGIPEKIKKGVVFISRLLSVLRVG